MAKQLKSKCILCYPDTECRPGRKAVGTRLLIAERFKSLCSMAGLKVPEVARTLHVTERTVYAWFSGATAVPYSAYKLLRILGGFELPGGWSGWRMHSGKLWTPEGFGFDPADGVWWAGVCRRARLFHELYRKNGDLARQLAAKAPEGPRLRGGVGAAGAGLVTVSTSCRDGAETVDSDITGGINLTSHRASDTRYHFDHGMTSCPTHSASPLNSMKLRESAASGSASASMHSSLSPSMSTSIEPAPRPLPLSWPLPRMHLGWRQSVAGASV